MKVEIEEQQEDGKMVDGNLLGDANGVEPCTGRQKESGKWQRPHFTRKALMRCCLVKWILASTSPKEQGALYLSQSSKPLCCGLTDAKDKCMTEAQGSNISQSIMGGVMATLSLEARRRFSRPSFLSDCRHSTARYHRSVYPLYNARTIDSQGIDITTAMDSTCYRRN
ncbi:Calsenilin A-type potassium channel modulatory protein 3 DRE-antagonist modulator [Triplophysa tibetana]|uniref:Calsenilin A-type potassium channel modulatory protein 3 DRE-antagonist modulator n=1 Tax=Triplophysa tibetana TaxID=1572043 RepID=A0A5A9NX67_9TELE|nr:Calsenilin A-type potassium channel modulatory protein 3 DRE-antagonist modulator [Triplophysa tibetana]